jgi:hypothetical protein
MAAKVKTWVWIVVGVVALGILGVIVLAGVGFYLFSQHVQTEAVAAEDAEVRFADIRQRYGKDARPVIELDDRGDLLRTNPDRQAPVDAPTPTALHVMAYDADDNRIVRLSVPFWLLRLQKGGNARIDLGGRRVDLEELKLTVEDLERMGPALIVDHRDRRGQRVLVWSQ